MKHLLPCLLLAVLFSCQEKEIFFTAQDSLSFIKGNYQGTEFSLAVQGYIGRNHYIPFEKEGVPITGVSSSSLEPGLHIDRFDANLGKSIKLVVKGGQLHRQTFPARVSQAAITLIDYAISSQTQCPVVDEDTEVVIPLTMEITSWDHGILVGNFTTEEGHPEIIEGSFSLPIYRP